jgi:membrane protease YdiL (CAAX protease family)
MGGARPLGYLPTVPTALDHLIALLLAGLFPVWGATFGFQRLRRAGPDDLPRVRRSVYRAAMILLWGLTFATLALWLANGRPLAHIGLAPVVNGGLIGTGLGLVVVVVYVLRERRHILDDPEGLELVRRRLRHLEVVMPRAPGEMRDFVALSITAGVCEEVLYRGYLIWYFQHWLGLVPSAALAALLFGVGHTYQGPRGVALTAAVGAFLAAVYLLSGSLLVPVLLHALMDVHSGHLAYVAFRRQDAERAARRAALAGGSDTTGHPSAPQDADPEAVVAEGGSGGAGEAAPSGAGPAGAPERGSDGGA